MKQKQTLLQLYYKVFTGDMVRAAVGSLLLVADSSLVHVRDLASRHLAWAAHILSVNIIYISTLKGSNLNILQFDNCVLQKHA